MLALEPGARAHTQCGKPGHNAGSNFDSGPFQWARGRRPMADATGSGVWGWLASVPIEARGRVALAQMPVPFQASLDLSM